MPGYVYNGTAWKEMLPDGLQVRTPAGWKVCDNGYVYDGSAWREFFVRKIDPPANFRVTNLGAAVGSLNFAWTAVPRAVSYDIAVRLNDQGAHQVIHSGLTGTSVANVLIGEGVANGYYIRANGTGIQSVWSPVVRVRGGYSQTSIPGGQHTVSGPVASHNRWRANQWGYGGNGQPYWGYYDTVANRYHGFLEITAGQLQNAIYAAHGHVVNAGGWGAITAVGAWVNLSRLAGVGAAGSAVTAQVSLGWGISYGNGAEPPVQGNIFDIALQPAGARHDYGIPANWFTAIFQQHGPYNGLLFRPYRNDGGRQPYAALNADASWRMTYSWPTIITRHQSGTTAW